MAISLKTKLIIGFLSVIVLLGLVTTLISVRLISTGIISQVQDKVRTDLNSARHIYQDEIKKVEGTLRLTAQRFFIKKALAENDTETLIGELQQIRKRESLDMLTLTDIDGRVVVRSRNPSVCGDDQGHDQLVSRVLSGTEVIAGTVLAPREELIREGMDLAQQAYMKLIPTAKAKPSTDTEQTSGMMMKAAAPVFSDDGGLMGILYGGKLLNRNYEIVDEVKRTVYQGVTYKGKDIGTATIFQGDLRISTNVTRKDGNRAIGTRVSQEVCEQVFAKGRPWIGRAFVVENWYMTAYEPIKDIEGKIIGMLYVGILEEKFTDMRKNAIAILIGIILAGMITAVIVSTFLAKGVLRPVDHLISASRQWAKGNLDYRVKAAQRGEMAQLGNTLNLMASSLKERDDKLQEYTSRQVMKSDRLATLGQLAAGVAHEINNPLGAVLMYTHLALEDLEQKDVLRENLEKTIAETSRCKDIVKGLLDFARQSEPQVEQSDVNEILDHTLAVIEKQALFQNIKVTKILCPSLPRGMVDVSQMQQVFTNIVMNAAEAMEGKGTLTVTTRTVPDNQYIEVEFTDTGCGIPPEKREKIFDPFFTTKEVGKGTGLGLAVSHGIIARHEGTIEVTSEPGRGTSFIIRLPLKREED